MDKNYVRTLVTPNPKARDRKVGGFGVYTVWAPFFTTTNVEKVTNVDLADLGAPVRKVIDEKTGLLAFDKNGRPKEKVADGIRDQARTVMENLGANLQAFAGDTMRAKRQQYQDMVAAAQEAAQPVLQAENEAYRKTMDQLMAMINGASSESEAAPAPAEAAA